MSSNTEKIPAVDPKTAAVAAAKQQTEVEVEGSSEWGWEHTGGEDDFDGDSPPGLPPMPMVDPNATLDSSHHSTTGKEQSSNVPTKRLSKNGHGSHSDGKLSKSNSNSNNMLKGMTSSPSFQELEKAIGQTLALGLNNSESSNSLNSDDRHQYGGKNQRMSLQRSRSFGKQQQIFRPYSNNNLNLHTAPNARAELDAFINEYESRALILFHNPSLNPLTVRNAAQKCGVLYYIRPEFHSRYGVTLLSYFDLRAAVHAQSTLVRELGSEGSASAHFSVMLHAGAGTNSEEFRLVVQKIPSDYSETEIQSRFSQFGELRSIQKLFGESTQDPNEISYSVEYYNIQDARLAASELSATISQFWGPAAEISFAPLDSRKQVLCRQLLATLSRWRAELAALTQFSQQPPPMMMGTPGGYAVPQYGGDTRNMMMMMPPQYYQQAPYPMNPQQQQQQSMMYQQQQQQQQQAVEYGIPVRVPSHEDLQQLQYYAQQQQHQMSLNMGVAYAPPPELVYGGWQQQQQPQQPPQVMQQQQQPMPMMPLNPQKLSPPMIPVNQMPVMNKSSSGIPPNKEYSPSQDNRPQHHNGGHGYARKTRPVVGAVGGSGGSMGGSGVGGGGGSGMSGNSAEPEYQVDMMKLAISDSSEPVERRTTLMIRNIPNKYSQTMLLDEINANHEGKYDFFYLPIDFKNRCNVGYAFISFLEPVFVAPFIREFEGQRWSNFNSDKVCAISFARIQGKAAMISRFQNSSLLEKDDEYRPLLFYSDGPNRGKPEPFPQGNRRNISQQQQQQQQQQRHTYDGEGGTGEGQY